jgi:hypothetical protein
MLNFFEANKQLVTQTNSSLVTDKIKLRSPDRWPGLMLCALSHDL